MICIWSKFFLIFKWSFIIALLCCLVIEQDSFLITWFANLFVCVMMVIIMVFICLKGEIIGSFSFFPCIVGFHCVRLFVSSFFVKYIHESSLWYKQQFSFIIMIYRMPFLYTCRNRNLLFLIIEFANNNMRLVLFYFFFDSLYFCSPMNWFLL